VDTFRYLYPDKTGAYSWWSYRFNARKNNAGWRIDYFIVSDRLKCKIKGADIWSEILGSDHCPVVLELDFLSGSDAKQWNVCGGKGGTTERVRSGIDAASKDTESVMPCDHCPVVLELED